MSDGQPSAGRPPSTAIAPPDELLLASLRALAAAGGVEEACRLAGRACAFYRQADPRIWSRFNVLLHRLAPKAGGTTQE